MKYNLIGIVIFTMFAMIGCDKEDPEDQLVLPSELNVSVQQDENIPGKVVLNLSSQGTNYYLVNFGENPQATPINTRSNTVEHQYSSSGTYTINVQAHATATGYISKQTEVSVVIETEGEGGETGIPTSGYSTPESYEGMTLVWQDEFNGNQLNPEDWTFEIGTGSNGWGNNELQYYREENTSVADGYLIITAKEESFQGRDYTSSRIITQGKQSFQYGRIDIRAALPKGQGIWPALWMLGADFSTTGWPACGEIDIMEMIGGGAGKDNVVHGTVHWSNAGQYASYGKGYTLTNGTFADEFHVFSIVWNETSISWLVDDVQYNEVDITPDELSEFRQEFFFIFNVAVGGNWPGSPNANTTFPQKMVVDYVRVFQPE